MEAISNKTESVEVAMNQKAEKILSERIDESLEGEQRFKAIIELMEELNDGSKENYLLNEAIAKKLTLEKADYDHKAVINRVEAAA